MADNPDLEHRPPDLTDPEQRHENRGVNIWAIGKVGIGLILTTILSLFLVLGIFRALELRENAAQIPPSPGINVDARRLPPEPRLIENEPENLQQMRGAEDKILNGYSWADEKHTLVKIPIDRAIDMLAQRGLPSVKQNAPPDTASVPTESGLGPQQSQPGGPLASQLAEGQGK